MKPRILISGCMGSRKNYDEAIWAAGGIPCSYYLPQPSLDYDGLLLCGGGDLEPACYGQENTNCRSIDPARDAIELKLTKMYLDAGKPILGICRGHQVIHVALGGTLLQDLMPEQLCFHNAENGDVVHPIRTLRGSRLQQLYSDTFCVNSAHHQAIDLPGEGMRHTAWSESRIVEASEHVLLPVLTVQWHPERMTGKKRRMDTADGAAVFDWLIKSC